MDWVSQHLQLLIAIGGAIAWWLSQRKAAEPADVPPPKGKVFEDPELADRTRRIREEIQRKIEQRVRGSSQPPAQPPPRSQEPDLAGLPPILRELMGVPQSEPPPAPRESAAQIEAQRNAEVLERQAALVEQLKQAKEMKAATMRRPQYTTEAGTKEEVAAVAVRGAMGVNLRDPAALRRAIVLREILGPPVALR